MKKQKTLLKVVASILVVTTLLATISFPTSASAKNDVDSELTYTSDQINTNHQIEKPIVNDNIVYENELVDTLSDSLLCAQDSKILDYVNVESFKTSAHIARIEELEELNTYVFQNADGTRSVYLMNENVKYIDSKGIVKEKDISLIKKDKGYVLAQSNIDLLLPNNPTDGVDIGFSDYDIKLTPQITNSSTVRAARKDDNTVIYDSFFGNNTALAYTPLLSGVKEDIILTEYTDDVTYTFVLETDGLSLYNNGSKYYLAENEKADPVFYLGEIIIYDAIGKPDMGTMTVETVTEGQEYLLTVSANEEFLSDPTTLYPVTIDPSLTVSDTANGINSIEDAPVYAGYPNTNFGAYLFNPMGTPDSTFGVGRTVVRLNGLINSEEYIGITDTQIQNVTFHILDVSGTVTQNVNLHPLTDNTTWTESTVTWNNIGSYTTSANYGTSMGAGTWAEFDITLLVRCWKNNIYSQDAGFILVNEDETHLKTFASSEYSTASYHPYVVMTYSEGISRSLYYSKYDPTKYNNSGSTPTVGTVTNLIQYRMNCYGYAFGYILNGSTTVTQDGGYKQQPGEFASTANKANTVMNTVYGNPAASMANVVSNMRLDASRLGFTLTEYSTSSSTVAQYGTSSRLIAVVTGADDYHFYMQHNDGTWSHKPGSNKVINTSLDSGIILTNSNIKALANEGSYANGALKFFVISKTAVVDYSHGVHCCLYWPCSHTQSTLYLKELAGDYLQTSKTKYTGSTSARIDFAQDHDVYCFTPSTTETYTVTTTCSSGADLDCKLYDNAGVVIGQSMALGQVSMTVTLVAGQKYYFDVYNYSKTVTDYSFNIYQEG